MRLGAGLKMTQVGRGFVETLFFSLVDGLREGLTGAARPGFLRVELPLKRHRQFGRPFLSMMSVSSFSLNYESIYLRRPACSSLEISLSPVPWFLWPPAEH